MAIRKYQQAASGATACQCKQLLDKPVLAQVLDTGRRVNEQVYLKRHGLEC
jgi:hypothetical protein